MTVAVSEIAAAVEFLRTRGGFDLIRIHPADSPREARLVRDGFVLDLSLGLATGATIVIEGDANAGQFPPEERGPDGIIIREVGTPALHVPPVIEETSVGAGDTDGLWHVGRAGMEYRDLVPSRLGGSVIASNIRIRSAGPVPDYVHHHDVLFQLIYCRRGWVKVVYEDQGDPFVLHAGDCVIQPPGIRHRVLENSDGMEVVEIGYPAEHMTFVEHEMKLPNGVNPTRSWHGQTFIRHDRSNRTWSTVSEGVERSDTGIFAATMGLADVDVLRLKDGASLDFESMGLPNHPRIVFVVDGGAYVRLSGTDHLLNVGSTVSLCSDHEGSIIAVSDTVLLRVTLDASRDLDHWRPIA
jgi:quercetin dioxygenase-like cupin family protein